MNQVLLDTGPLVAYLNGADSAHGEVSPFFESFSGQLHTSSAVITEAMDFLAASVHGPAVLAEYVAASQMQVHDLAQSRNLRAAASLMAKYADAPMDYADATLLLLAESLQVRDILTLDRRGFSFFRTRPGWALRIVGGGP